MHFGYRHSLIKEEPLIVTQATLALARGSKQEIRGKMEELAARRAKWQPREPEVTTGYLARYREMVTSGNRGAILEKVKK